jgi:PhoD-like phosphatase
MGVVHKSFILYVTGAVLVLNLMLHSASVVNVGRNLQTLEEEPGAAAPTLLQGNDACYQGMDRKFEAYTTLDWWNTEATDRYITQTSFFKNRPKFEPLEARNTMIAGVLFSFSNHTLKMSVLFPPLYPDESRAANLLLTSRNTGELVATRECDIIPNTWKCGFRVDSSDLLADKEQDYAYEIQYQPRQDNAPSGGNEATISYTYDGVIPVPRQNPRIVGLGCFGPDTTTNKDSLVSAVNALKPDVIALQGDQAYFHDNLGFGFLQLVYSISEMTRSVPTIVQMDDHDYGEPNLWGANDSLEADSGTGFFKPVCLINELEEFCMGHNPDAATKETLQNGIDIYYTNYIYGRLDFAILEARKFKNKNAGDALLGDKQEAWLQDWCDNDRDRLKVVLTQTPFAGLSTHATEYGGGMHEIKSDDDTNGSPVEGRRRAMDILSGCSNLVLSGDQHLAIGVTYEDYGVTECASPAALNSVWWRRNNKKVGSTHVDLYGNEYTLHAVWNVDQNVTTRYKMPSETVNANASTKQVRADGFLVVDIINMEATCATHSYHAGILQSPIWEFTVPVSLPS